MGKAITVVSVNIGLFILSLCYLSIAWYIFVPAFLCIAFSVLVIFLQRKYDFNDEDMTIFLLFSYVPIALILAFTCVRASILQTSQKEVVTPTVQNVEYIAAPTQVVPPSSNQPVEKQGE